MLPVLLDLKPDKVKRHTIIDPVDKGGLNMVDFTMMVVKSLKETVVLNTTDILYSYKPESNLFQALNQFVINAKYHIFLSWLNKASPSFEIFSLLLNEEIRCERTIAFKNNTLTNFGAKWTTLCAWAAQITPCLGGCATYVLFTSSFIFTYVLLVLILFPFLYIILLLK